MAGIVVLFTVALPLAFARVVTPTKTNGAGPSTLELTDILEKAVVLMERGTEKLVQDGRIQEARLSASEGAAGAAEAQENVGAMEKILKDFRSLHLIAQKLRGKYRTETDQLKADKDDKGSLLTVAQSRTKVLQQSNADLQAMLKDEMKGSEKCAKELRTLQNHTCDRERAQDAETIKALQAKTTSLEGDLNSTKEELLKTTQKLQGQIDDLSPRLEQSAKENEDLKAQLQALQTQLQVSEEHEKTLNTTVQDYAEKLALAKDKQEDTEEERDSAEESFKELNVTYGNAKQQLVAKEQAEISAQKALDIANSDKGRLLDSVRMLMHENDEFQRRLVEQSKGELSSSPAGGASSSKKHHKRHSKQASAASASAPPAAAASEELVVNASTFVRASANASNTTKYDSIEWMDKTKKIDEYLSRISPLESDEAPAKAVSAPPSAPEAPLLADYFDMKQTEVKAASKGIAAAGDALKQTTTTPAAPPIARYLRATSSPSDDSEVASAAFVRQKQARAKQDEDDLASMKDIKEANTLYSEAERLIQSAGDS